MFVLKVSMIASLVLLSACGFNPLYGPHASTNTHRIEQDLAQIKIVPLAERTGQILHNYLRDKLNPLGEPAYPQAYLQVTLSLRKDSISIRKDGTTQRFNIVSTAHITLWDHNHKKILYKDTSERTASFSIGDATAEYAYASTISETDAKKRTLLLIAEDLQLMLATYYKKWLHTLRR